MTSALSFVGGKIRVDILSAAEGWRARFRSSVCVVVMASTAVTAVAVRIYSILPRWPWVVAGSLPSKRCENGKECMVSPSKVFCSDRNFQVLSSVSLELQAVQSL